MKETLEQKAQKATRKVVQRLITHISTIAIFIALGIIALAYSGLTFTVTLELVVSIAVPSVILTASTIIIYELWMRNGVETAKGETEYINLLDRYTKESTNLDNEVMQEFLDAEKERRHDVEKNRLTAEIERLTKINEKLEASTGNKFVDHINKLRLRHNRHILKKLYRHKDHIIIDMPYAYSEQFDLLRYSANTTNFKEYKPNDTKHFIIRKRTRKYIYVITYTLIGFNIVQPAIGGQHWLVALFMTILAAISLIASVVTGFSNGYTAISVSSTGVYNTALQFIEKAKIYCDKHDKVLYYTLNKKHTESNEEQIINESLLIAAENDKREESKITKNIFDTL